MMNLSKYANSHFNPEQIQAITEWGNNILVSASAGSGKTSVLIERILFHLEERQFDISELLVVTFTEAAAQEMKERLENRLKQAVNQTQSPSLQENYIHQINQLPLAHIRTLHSFCLQVVQNFFYLIDFNPNFTLMTDETQLYLIYEKVWAQLIEDIYNDEQSLINRAEYFDLLQIFSNPRTDTRLFELILDLINFSASHTDPEGWLQQIIDKPLDLQILLASPLFQDNLAKEIDFRLKDSLQKIELAQNLVNGFESQEIDRYQPVIEAEKQIFTSLLEQFLQGDIQEFLTIANNASFTRWPNNNEKKADYFAIEETKKFREDWKKNLEKIQDFFKYPFETLQSIELANQATIQSLGKLALAFHKSLQAYKLQNNFITYNDLEHLTLDILAPREAISGQRQPSTAAIYYQDKFKEVMVDEYQDINDIQAKILSYLSHENNPELTGNLFMVGDVKQSIYGFRMAEPSLFLQKYNLYKEGQEGILIILDKNYRSRHEVLQFTNFIFERIMDEDFGQMNYGQDEALKTGNHSFIPQAPSDKYNIELLLYCSGQDEAKDKSDEEQEDDSYEVFNLDTSIEGQAHLIAQNIQAQVLNQKSIYDKKLGKERPIRYSDIVILSSTKKPFNTIQEVFSQYHIPVFSQKVENYFQRQEIQIMIALLKILDNPIQDIPLVAVLRSYFLGLSDEELAIIRSFNKTGSYYEAVRSFAYSKDEATNLEVQEKLLAFIEQFHKWQKLASRISLVELIWTIYLDSQYLEYNSGLANGSQRLANLHALYERAQNFESQQLKGLANFVAYIEKVMDQDRDLAEPILLDEGENFVRIMTVHASKGLEFPILYLMNTEKKFNTQDLNKAYIGHKDYGIATDFYDIDNKLRYSTVSKEAFKSSQESKLKAEEMRKLYVALTRCEQKLYIVGSVKSQDTWQEEIDNLRDKMTVSTNKVPQGERRNANSWLKWIQQAMAVDNTGKTIADFSLNQIESQFVDQTDLKEVFINNSQQNNFKSRETFFNENIKVLAKVDSWDYLNRLMAYQYPYQVSSQTSSFQSVSELKRLNEEPIIEKSDYYSNRSQSSVTKTSQSYQEEYPKPQFMKSLGDKPDYASLGTLTHYIMQTLDYEKFADFKLTDYQSELSRQFSIIETDNEALKEAASHINFENILAFLYSDLGQMMINNANKIKKEYPFSLLMDSQAILGSDQAGPDDQLLIHGIIDAYIEEADSVILIDFKTDRFHSYGNKSKSQQIQIMIKKYQLQMKLYQKALETTLNKPVIQVFLALLDFRENIDLLNKNL